jgi:hypothetical protein
MSTSDIPLGLFAPRCESCTGEMRDIGNRFEGNCAQPFFDLFTNSIKGTDFTPVRLPENLLANM